MSIKQHTKGARGSRWFTPALLSAAVVLLVVPGIAAAGGGDMGSEGKSQMVAEAKWHMARNGLLNCVVIHGAVGLPPSQTSVNFFVHPSSSASSVVPYMPGRQVPAKGKISNVTVPAVSVASEWRRTFGDIPVDLLKIDIEGKERDFIELEAALLRTRVRRIVLEWHKWCVTLAELDDALAAIGFGRQESYGEREFAGMATYQNLLDVRVA